LRSFSRVFLVASANPSWNPSWCPATQLGSWAWVCRSFALSPSGQEPVTESPFGAVRRHQLATPELGPMIRLLALNIRQGHPVEENSSPSSVRRHEEGRTCEPDSAAGTLQRSKAMTEAQFHTHNKESGLRNLYLLTAPCPECHGTGRYAHSDDCSYANDEGPCDCTRSQWTFATCAVAGSDFG